MSALNEQLHGSLALMEKAHAIEAAHPEWERKLALIKRTVAPGLTDEEFQLFCHVAKTRQLDPLQRQIHAVKRRNWNNDTKSWEEKLTIQIGIDGFRAIANRTGLYMPSDKAPLIEDVDDPQKMRVTVWVKKYHRESKTWNEFAATAYFREFAQMAKDKNTNEYKPAAMWAKMPLSMTEKCAEAKALRRGWPEELGQVYVPEEVTEHPMAVLQGEPSEAMDEGAVSDYLADIEAASTVDELQKVYFAARDAAAKIGDKHTTNAFAEAKNKRYIALAKAVKK